MTKITGIFACFSSAFRMRMTSKPFMPGMAMSSRIRSGVTVSKNLKSLSAEGSAYTS